MLRRVSYHVIMGAHGFEFVWGGQHSALDSVPLHLHHDSHQIPGNTLQKNLDVTHPSSCRALQPKVPTGPTPEPLVKV